jgi:hypothetical protein
LARVDCRNTTRYWNDPHLAGLSCLCADFTAHDYAPHSHEALVVAVTEAGGSEFRSRGEVNEASTSVLLVFNPAEPHSGRMARSARWRYRGHYLTETALESLAETLGVESVPYFTANLFRDTDLIEAFLDLHRALQKGTDAFLECETLVGSLGQLFRRHGSRGERIPVASRDRGDVSSIQALMQDRYGERLTLEDMGRTVDLTPFQLIGLFKRNGRPDAARLPDAGSAEGGDPGDAAWRRLGRIRTRRRLLRSERPDQPLQARLWHHPSPVGARRHRGPPEQFRPITGHPPRP